MEDRESKRRKKEHDQVSFLNLCESRILIEKQDGTDRDNSTGKPPLLALPPELRNTIWELCLKNNHGITITPDLKEPAVLKTCRQIRGETRDMSYNVNAFRIFVTDCDDSVLSAFTKHIDAIEVVPLIHLRIVGKRDRSNLIKWCKNLFTGDSMMLYKGSWNDQRSTVVAAAHDIVKQHDDWSECERALETLETVVRKLRPKWA